MKKENKEFFIYLHAMHKRVSVTEEQFHEYYREIDSFRRKQQRHNKCNCPKSKRLLCDIDCAACPYHTEGDTLSLDLPFQTNNNETTHTLGSLIADKSPLPADQIELERLISKIHELMPEAIRIGQLRLEGKSDEAIAKEIGINRKTFLYRLNRLENILRKEFPDFF